MRTLLAILVITTCAHACGTERAIVKNLKDNPTVRYQGAATIAQLRALPRPADLSHRTPLETEAFTVQAHVTAFKLETDGDYHLVLSDGQRTMIGEIPDPRCGRKSEAAAYRKARALIARLAGPVPAVGKLKKLAHPLRVNIRGIVFFDKIHGQTGVAPSGVELHPILLIAK